MRVHREVYNTRDPMNMVEHFSRPPLTHTAQLIARNKEDVLKRLLGESLWVNEFFILLIFYQSVLQPKLFERFLLILKNQENGELRLCGALREFRLWWEKKNNQYNIHHLIPKSREWARTNTANLVSLLIINHQEFHAVFWNATPIEVFAMLLLIHGRSLKNDIYYKIRELILTHRSQVANCYPYLALEKGDGISFHNRLCDIQNVPISLKHS